MGFSTLICYKPCSALPLCCYSCIYYLKHMVLLYLPLPHPSLRAAVVPSTHCFVSGIALSCSSDARSSQFLLTALAGLLSVSGGTGEQDSKLERSSQIALATVFPFIFLSTLQDYCAFLKLCSLKKIPNLSSGTKSLFKMRIMLEIIRG